MEMQRGLLKQEWDDGLPVLDDRSSTTEVMSDDFTNSEMI